MDLDRAAYEIARIDANLVLSRNYVPALKIGVRPLNIDQDVLKGLFSSKNLKDSEVLIGHCKDKDKIKAALEDIITGRNSIIGGFTTRGIHATNHFRKALFISSLGAKEGEKINYFVPSYGLEQISSFLNHKSSNTYAVSINANLCGEKRLYDILNKETWDIIGFNAIPLTFYNTARMIGRVSIDSPKSLKLLGGYNIDEFDYEAIFKSFNIDMIVTGPAEETVLAIAENPNSLEEVVMSNKNIVTPTRMMQKLEMLSPIYLDWDLNEEIPLKRNDIYHQKNYHDANQEINDRNGVPEEQLENDILFLKMSDRCKGKCSWCAAPKRDPKGAYVKDVLKKLRESQTPSGIHFLDNDLCFDRKRIIELCREIIKGGYSTIPKIGKARSDTVDEEVLGWLAKAGFKKFGYGIESFDQRVMDGLGKGLTVEQNHKAIQNTFNAGITPIMNMIFFSPWETRESILHTIEETMPYIESGAILNSAVGMNATYGSEIIHSRKDLIVYEKLDYPGMKSHFNNPIRIKCPDSSMQNLLDRTLEERERFKTSNPQMRKIERYSSHLNTLCAIRTILELFGKDSNKVDKLIKQTLK